MLKIIDIRYECDTHKLARQFSATLMSTQNDRKT